jgi:hypothetical protein
MKGLANAALCIMSAACTQQVEIGRITIDLAKDAAAKPDAALMSDAESTPVGCVPTVCKGRTFACGDCQDNDGDGLFDEADPECFSACDGDEEQLGSGAQSCMRQACYFEPDCGLGNDADCLTLTPNGCDCFGCCSVDGSAQFVFIGVDAPGSGQASKSGCTSSSLNDPERCQSCEPDRTCFNACEPGEACFGQATQATCGDASTAPQCDVDTTACGPCFGHCPADQLCVSGCCVPGP